MPEWLWRFPFILRFDMLGALQQNIVSIECLQPDEGDWGKNGN